MREIFMFGMFIAAVAINVYVWAKIIKIIKKG